MAGSVASINSESSAVPALPQIKANNKIDKRILQAPDHTCDYLPEEILFVLTQPPAPSDLLGPPPNRLKNIHTSSQVVVPRRPPANVWHFTKQREKFKHLMKNTPCICGAGKDISFLYDVPQKRDLPIKSKEIISSSNDISAIRAEDPPQSIETKKHFQLSDTLIPEEYHIVRNKGVKGLECEQGQYSIQPIDHEKHLVLFPSMNPASRFEVIHLKQTLQDMLEKAGVDDFDEELNGPSQMHQLVDLIKKEQNIYNVIFHELIRQVSIECVERGELLAEVRTRYSDIFSRVPKQIKSLHEEVLAQRALDRRLTEELINFKSTITILTSELTALKEHDKEVSRQAMKTQDELKNALAEAHKNSDLLSEYQELYELQRKRLEKEIKSLSIEGEMWCNACYTLANKVMEEYNLNSARQLCIVEKSWHQLAGHFTVALTENDTSDLTALQSLTDQWRQEIDQFYLDLKDTEEEIKKQIRGVISDIVKWKTIFESSLSSNKRGQTSLDKEKLNRLIVDLKYWQQLLSNVSDKFGGDVVLSNQDILRFLQTKTSQWTNCSIKLFNRHQALDNSIHPCQSLMIDTNQQVESLVKQLQNRVTGENGVADRLIHVTNNLEAWDTRLNMSLNDSMTLSGQQWIQFIELLDDWTLVLTEALKNVGKSFIVDSNKKTSEDNVDISDVLRSVHKWMTTTAHNIDSEDAKLSDQVDILHRGMVHWMTQALMGLAPDRKQLSAEAKEVELLYRMTKSELHEKAKTLAIQLSNFTKYLANCCSLFVYQEMQRKLDSQEDNATHEQQELQRLTVESDDWIKISQLVLSELIEVKSGQSTRPSSTNRSAENEVSLPDGASDEEVEEDDDDEEEEEEIKETQSTKAEDELSLQMITLDSPLPRSHGDEPQGGEPLFQSPPREYGDVGVGDGKVTPAVSSSSPQLMKTESSNEVKVNVKDHIDDNGVKNKVIGNDIGEMKVFDHDEDGVKGHDKSEMKVKGHDDNDEVKISGCDDDDEVKVKDHDNDEIEVIGYDRSTRTVQMMVGALQPLSDISAAGADGRLMTETSGSGYDALLSIQFLQQQLLTTESRAQNAESRASRAEKELEEALEKIRMIERSTQPTPSPTPSTDTTSTANRSTMPTVEPRQRRLATGAEKVPKEKSSHKTSSKKSKKK